MNHNYTFSNINEALPILMSDLLHDGAKFGSRAGETVELTHVGISLDRPWERELVLTDRKANVAAQIAETMWVLTGRNDVAWLGNYLPRAADFSDDGLEWRAGYGPRLRNYQGVDQLAYIVDTIADSPGSRQAVATIWDPTVDTTPGKDIACNNWLSFSARGGRLDLHVGIRSNDAMWGWSGINAFEWSTLLELVASLTDLKMGSLHFSVTSFHLYEQHWAKAQKIASNPAIAFHDDSPRMNLGGYNVLARFHELASEWFRLEEAIRFGRPVGGAVDAFSEPMLQSWLRVLQWYWSGEEGFLKPLARTRLKAACLLSVKPAGRPQNEPLYIEDQHSYEGMYAFMGAGDSPFLDFVNRLHAQKHAAYGDSWKRRGEYMILANIARKVDRLESGEDTPDETQADTAQDLMVYLAKYTSWLHGGQGDPAEVRNILQGLGDRHPFTLRSITDNFGRLETCTLRADKIAFTDNLLRQAYGLALSLWPK